MKVTSPIITSPTLVQGDTNPPSSADGGAIRAALVAAGLLRPGARVVTPGDEPAKPVPIDAPTLPLSGPPTVPGRTVGLTSEDAPPDWAYHGPVRGDP
jgi:hypothetical protein